jgi:nucleotide-binding universal stress UspA family protein
MTPNPKSQHILCAVLGKPTSRTTVTKAIDLALEHKARLTFFHVINAEFLAAVTPSMKPLRAVYNQLREMGEFSMLILCDRAQRRGVKNVDYIIREGQILPQIHLAIREMQPDIIVLGKPAQPQSQKLAIPIEEIENFVSTLEQNPDIQVIPVDIKSPPED